MLTDDGWLRTGDIATVDEAGRFCVVDRLKELIKYKGYQVPPAQLEGILLTHPQIADACVVPVRDEEAGEVPKAFVVPRAGEPRWIPRKSWHSSPSAWRRTCRCAPAS